MFIEKIVYHKTFNLGNYSSEKIGVEFMLNQGEDAKFALEEARKLVHEYHQQSSAGLDHSHIEEHSLPPEPAVLPEIQVEKQDTSLEEQIRSCTEWKVLETYRLIVKNNPHLQHVYDVRKSEIQEIETQQILEQTEARLSKPKSNSKK